MTTVAQLISSTRSVRRFQECEPVGEETLTELVDLARFSASAANLQPLKYLFSFTPRLNDKIFPHLGWAGYLKEWPGPKEGERPAAYIVVCADTTINERYDVDLGIALQSIRLGATERGLGSCVIVAIKRQAIYAELGLPDHIRIVAVVPVGKPAERVVIEPLNEGGDVTYWRDANGVHHVPKRALDDLIIT